MRWLTLNTKWIRINSKVGVPMAPVFSVRESLASLHGRNQIHLVPISIGWCVGIRKGSKWRARPHPMNRNTTSSATTTTAATSSRCKPSASATRSTGPPRLRTTCARLFKCPLSKCPVLYCLHCIIFDNVRKGEKLACVKNLVKQIGEFKDVNISSFT